MLRPDATRVPGNGNPSFPSQEWLRSAFVRTPVGIAITDANGKFLEANPAFAISPVGSRKSFARRISFRSRIRMTGSERSESLSGFSMAQGGSTRDETTAVAFYAIGLTLPAICWTLMRLYASYRYRLIDPRLAPPVYVPNQS
jgi:hypothetical protein